MSASIKPTLYPWFFNAIAKFAATVDLPTPPLPEATATTLFTFDRAPLPISFSAIDLIMTVVEEPIFL